MTDSLRSPDQTGAPFEPEAAWLDTTAAGVLVSRGPARLRRYRGACTINDLGLFADHADFDAEPPVLRWRDGRTLSLGKYRVRRRSRAGSATSPDPARHATRRGRQRPTDPPRRRPRSPRAGRYPRPFFSSSRSSL
ncbi:Hypothetical protein BCPG_02115 [Burkholderia cenocepacia PC184]|nr:Hypothetical protein BCPG_02115 [Burkholderia cenocepacia PC184]